MEPDGSWGQSAQDRLGGGGFGAGHDASRIYGPWHDSAGGMNTKSELPSLPASASPLQFGDWLHSSSPVMKDISGTASWWWDCTLREAQRYYERWKESTRFNGFRFNLDYLISSLIPEFIAQNSGGCNFF